MLRRFMAWLCCPACLGKLALAKARTEEDDRILNGTLACDCCGSSYPIIRGVPRFVPFQNYAEGFGFQWKTHALTQYDSTSGVEASRKRFLEEAKWPLRLDGERILEVGCGAGRFSVHALATGAEVASIDYSAAVDVNYQINGQHPNSFMAQADLYKLPFPEGHFDRVLCLGVLQHTPDVEGAFFSLLRYLRPGGALVADVYAKNLRSYYLNPKYLARPLSRRLSPERLYSIVRKYIDLMWPVARLIRRLPRGQAINWRLLIADHSHLGLAEQRLKEWAYLDTLDMLSPRYDNPQTIRAVQRWTEEAGLVDVEVQYGYNGIEIRGRRPPIT